MKKKKSIVLISIGALCMLAVLLFIMNAVRPEEPTPQEMMGRLENTLGDEWEKESQTEIIPFELSANDGSSIVYYVCKTTYYEIDPPEITGLSPVLTDVVDPETADGARTCEVSGLDAMLYEKDGRVFLCWTASAEYSFAIEYSPEEVSEEDIFKMAESVPANDKNARNLAISGV